MFPQNKQGSGEVGGWVTEPQWREGGLLITGKETPRKQGATSGKLGFQAEGNARVIRPALT